MRLVLAFLLLSLYSNAADAQLCPGGQCPTSAFAPYLLPRIVYTTQTPRPSVASPSSTAVRSAHPPQDRTPSPTPIVRYQKGAAYTHADTKSPQPTSARTSLLQTTPVTFNGSSKWSYPGDLRRHMQEHGLPPSSASTLTRRDLQAMHDTIHDRKDAAVGRDWGVPDSSDVRTYLR